MDAHTLIEANNNLIRQYHSTLSSTIVSDGQAKLVLEPRRVVELEVSPFGAIFFEAQTFGKPSPICLRMIKATSDTKQLKLEPDEDVIIYASSFNKLPSPVNYTYCG